MISDLAAYIYHAERFGPECVFETAVNDLSERDLGELKAWLDSRHRSYYWQVGRRGGPDSKWMPRQEKPRQCEHCGLDLPPGMQSTARYHSHCRRTAYSRRLRSKKGPNEGPDIALRSGGGPRTAGEDAYGVSPSGSKGEAEKP